MLPKEASSTPRLVLSPGAFDSHRDETIFAYPLGITFVTQLLLLCYTLLVGMVIGCVCQPVSHTLFTVSAQHADARDATRSSNSRRLELFR